MTHAERAARRSAVRSDLRAGLTVREAAKRHGLSYCYVKEVAKDSGLSRPVGRPPLIICPTLRRQYHCLAQKVTAPIARQMMGLPL
jgi:hypothetical protein